MIKALRGLMAVCLMVVFSALAFSPGITMAAEQAIVTQAMISDFYTPSILPEPTGAAGQPRYDKRGTASNYSQVISSAQPKADGYLNWRYRDSQRSV